MPNLLNRNWGKIFFVAALGIFALNIAGIVINIIGIITIIGINVINIYCTFFSFLTLSAELRQFSLFRRFVSSWLKYFTFLLFYRSRAIFYVMYGLLLIGTGILNTIAGFAAIGTGIVMFIVSFFVVLPVYSDMKEAEKEYEQKINQYAVEQPHTVEDPTHGSTEHSATGNHDTRTIGGWVPPSMTGDQDQAKQESPKNSPPRPSYDAFNLRPSDFITAEEEKSDDDHEQNLANRAIIGPSAFASKASIENRSGHTDV